MSIMSHDNVAQKKTGSILDPALEQALYGPIDLEDTDSWHRSLHQKRWSSFKEMVYQRKVAAALAEGRPVPPRFDPAAGPTRQSFSIKALIAKRAQKLSSPEEAEATSEEETEMPNVQEEGQEEPQEDAAGTELPPEWLLRMYASARIFNYLTTPSEPDHDSGLEDEENADEIESVVAVAAADAVAEVTEVVEDAEIDDAPEEQSLPVALPPKRVGKDGYPIWAFGQYAPAVDAIARIVQVSPSMVGIGLIGVLSPLGQPLINVAMKQHDEGKPVTVNVLCVADSGERKSSVLDALLKPVLQALRGGDNGRGAMITSDITVDGLIKGLIKGCPSQYICTSEMVTLLGSHAMSEEAKGRFFGTVSGQYCGEPMSRTRADEHVFAEDRRLSVMLFGQPVVVRSFLGSELVMQQGTANRFLFAWPQSLRGTRFYTDEELEVDPDYVSLTERLQALAREPWVIDEQTKGVAPRTVRLTPQAKALWVAFQNECEHSIAPGGRYEDFVGYVSRFPEQVRRIAALLALLDDTQVREIDGDTMERALALGRYHFRQAIRLFVEMAADN